MKVRVTQIKSGIGRTLRQKQTLASLGLRKMNQSREHELTPQIKVKVEEI